MSKDAIMADLRKAVETWDFKLVQTATQAAIDEKIPVGEIIGEGLQVRGIKNQAEIDADAHALAELITKTML